MYGVDDDKKTPTGLKPNVGPGYSGFQPVQRLQVASDNGKQRKAVAADEVATGLTRQAGAAVDSAMQVGALENAGVLPPSQGGSVTPILSPERVAQIKARQAAPLIAGVNQAIDQSGRVPNGVQLPGINQSLSPMAQQAPLPEPRGLAAQPVGPSTAENYANGLAGAGKVALHSVAYAGNAIQDGVRNTVGYVSDGNTDQITQYRDESAAKVGEGYDQMATASANLRSDAQQAGRDALGIEKSAAAPGAPVVANANAGELPAPAAGTATPKATAQAGPASDAGPQAPSNGFAPIGLDPKQFGPGSDKIVGRVSANGVPEFSNDAADVAGASGQFQAPTGLKPQTQSSQQVAPNGAQALASGTNMPAEPRGLAATGRASNIGNGVGTFSVMGQPGDAAKAIATYDRANAIRAETNKMATAGEPRGLTIVKDSSRTPSLQERKLAKLENLQAQTDELQARGLRDKNNSDREFARNTANDQLNQQLQSFQINAAQRAEQLQAAYQQSTDPQEKAALAEQIRVMTGKEQPNRFTVVPGGQEYDAAAGALVNRPSRVLNNQSGEFVDGPGATDQPTAAATPAVGTVAKGYRFNGGDPKDQKNWSKV